MEEGLIRMLSNAMRGESRGVSEFRLLRQRLQTWLRRQPHRQLRCCESLSLGEKRFVAVVQFEQMRFLVGGTASSIALISQLPDTHVAAADQDQELR